MKEVDMEDQRTEECLNCHCKTFPKKEKCDCCGKPWAIKIEQKERKLPVYYRLPFGPQTVH